MSQPEETAEQIATLLNQVSLARREINNLRQQLTALQHVHRKECDAIQRSLSEYRCPTCPPAEPAPLPAPPPSTSTSSPPALAYIGTIRTIFPEKRATPRQPGICPTALGKLQIDRNLFTNPGHTLDGLEHYSHLWILFHFHRNAPGFARAKVAPPRLNGARAGVFATRSPHRPTPVGLSLVRIERVEDDCVYFHGVDMVDGTPVVDIKPYIPQYDSPFAGERRPLDGEEEDDEERGDEIARAGPPAPPPPPQVEREAPDGEEEEGATGGVRVADWLNRVGALRVTFDERALDQLEELGGEEKKRIIENVLREDPRPAYLRERWRSHRYIFRVADICVGCRFENDQRMVTVYHVFRSEANDEDV